MYKSDYDDYNCKHIFSAKSTSGAYTVFIPRVKLIVIIKLGNALIFFSAKHWLVNKIIFWLERSNSGSRPALAIHQICHNAETEQSR